ncbi:MAG TPA: hypothetical protein QF821_03160 [Candidatus Thalassarchaeaceae archaeon]|nr:hypothetical protein [Candidatus Thalassarchaeaceae archaeon]
MTDVGGDENVGGLPPWATSFFENYGAPSLEDLVDVFHGPLLDRKYGLRKDDLVEILLDKRMLPDDRDPWVRGMMIGGRSSSIDVLDENGEFRSISRDAIVEVRLVTHLRRTYIEDEELLKFEKDDMKRRSEVHELAEKTSEGHGSNLSWR